MTAATPYVPATCPASRVPATDARRTGTADPSVLKRAGLTLISHTGVGERQCVGERNERRECSSLEQADGDNHPERIDREIQQRSGRRENGEKRKLGTKDMKPVGEACGKRTA